MPLLNYSANNYMHTLRKTPVNTQKITTCNTKTNVRLQEFSLIIPNGVLVFFSVSACLQ